MRLSIVAAVAANGVIGSGNRMPWRLPADLKRFKALTMGHALIVGRKTYESIGRPLPGRRMIVVTRDPAYAAPGVEIARSLDEAIARAEDGEAFVGGGAEIYRETLPRAHRLYLTLIEREFDGDTYFPEYDRSAWRLVSEERHAAEGDETPPYRFCVFDRITADG